MPFLKVINYITISCIWKIGQLQILLLSITSKFILHYTGLPLQITIAPSLNLTKTSLWDNGTPIYCDLLQWNTCNQV